MDNRNNRKAKERKTRGLICIYTSYRHSHVVIPWNSDVSVGVIKKKKKKKRKEKETKNGHYITPSSRSLS